MTLTTHRGQFVRTMAALISVAVVAWPASSLAQGTAADDPVGLGGRVVVSEAGYAITLPQDWLHIQPSQAAMDVILDEVTAIVPELRPGVEAALSGGLGVSLIAYGDRTEGLPESCNIVDRARDGRSVDDIAQEEVAKLGALADIIAAGPELMFIELPAGRAARIDVGIQLPEIGVESTSYILVDEDWIHTMSCTDDARPADAWDSIARTFESLHSTD